MKKTEGITKYEVQWQLIRSSIKGSGTELESKLEEVRAYYLETGTYDRWERVYNWLEGIFMGYRASKSIANIQRVKDEMVWYDNEKKHVNIQRSYGVDKKNQLERLEGASLKSATVLWKDLFRTNSKWLKKGYYHQGCNDFMDWLWDNRQDIMGEVNYKYSMDWLVELRRHSKKSENNHKFFF